jgi:catalase
MTDGHAGEFVMLQYRHCKTILALGAAKAALDALGIADTLPSGEPDQGVLIRAGEPESSIADFVTAVSKHRHYARDTDPPVV